MKKQAIIPADIFRVASENIRDVHVITNIVENNGVYSIYIDNIDFNKFVKNNRISLTGCNELDGYHLLNRIYSTHVDIVSEVGRNFTLGTLLAYPYFRWGTKTTLTMEQNMVNEFPCIHNLVGELLQYGNDNEEISQYDGSFDFYFLDKIILANNPEYNSESDKIKDMVLLRMTDYANNFLFELHKLTNINSSQITHYIKEGAGSNPEKKEGSSYNTSVAGVRLVVDLSIDFKYNC